MVRTQQRVNQEYDATKWQRALRAVRQGCDPNEVMRQAFNGTPERVKEFCLYADRVLDLLLPDLSKHKQIIELGCGVGYWLNRLWALGYSGELGGFDISPTALVAARLLSVCRSVIQ